jgi:hypothetical protein
VSVKHRLNYTGGRKLKCLLLPSQNTWTGRRSNQGLRVERLATKHVSRDTALYIAGGTVVV